MSHRGRLKVGVLAQAREGVAPLPLVAPHLRVVAIHTLDQSHAFTIGQCRFSTPTDLPRHQLTIVVVVLQLAVQLLAGDLAVLRLVPTSPISTGGVVDVLVLEAIEAEIQRWFA